MPTAYALTMQRVTAERDLAEASGRLADALGMERPTFGTGKQGEVRRVQNLAAVAAFVRGVADRVAPADEPAEPAGDGLDDLSRADLDNRATEAGIEGATRLRNRQAVIDAIRAKQETDAVSTPTKPADAGTPDRPADEPMPPTDPTDPTPPAPPAEGDGAADEGE